MPQLVLLRHGQSLWNAENLFTGWYDVDLTEQGEEEARAAGRLLADEAGLDLRVVHTSLLTRAIRTADLTLEAAGRYLAPGPAATGGSTSATTAPSRGSTRRRPRPGTARPR